MAHNERLPKRPAPSLLERQWGISDPDVRDAKAASIPTPLPPPPVVGPALADGAFDSTLLPPHPAHDQAQALREPRHTPRRAFALIYLDEDNVTRLESSPEIFSKVSELFTPDVCHTFRSIVDDERRPAPQPVIRDIGRPAKRKRRADTSASRLPRKQHRQACHGAVMSNPFIQAADHSPISGRQPSVQRNSEPSSATAAYPSASATPSSEGHDDDDFDEYSGSSVVQTTISIGDKSRLYDYYEKRFRQLQQIPCKTIAKAWIKVVQPKKQSLNPYNGGQKARDEGKEGDGEVTRPEWWPPQGSGDCPHTEPDHVKKEQRLVLLHHLLRGIKGEPWERTVDEFKEGTKMLFRSGSKKDDQCRLWLDEIYYVKGKEDMFHDGGLDEEYCINICLPEYKERKPKPKKKTIHSSVMRKPKALKFAHGSALGVDRQTPPATHVALPRAKEQTVCGDDAKSVENVCQFFRCTSYQSTEEGLQSDTIVSPTDLDTSDTVMQLSSIPMQSPTSFLEPGPMGRASNPYHQNIASSSRWPPTTNMHSMPVPTPTSPRDAFEFDPPMRETPQNLTQRSMHLPIPALMNSGTSTSCTNASLCAAQQNMMQSSMYLSMSAGVKHSNAMAGSMFLQRLRAPPVMNDIHSQSYPQSFGNSYAPELRHGIHSSLPVANRMQLEDQWQMGMQCRRQDIKPALYEGSII